MALEVRQGECGLATLCRKGPGAAPNPSDMDALHFFCADLELLAFAESDSKRPIAPIRDQPGSHRIIANIMPFFVCRFLRSQQMVEHATLPSPLTTDCEPGFSFYQADPFGRIFFSIVGRNKRVNMVRHDDGAFQIPPIQLANNRLKCLEICFVIQDGNARRHAPG